MSLRETQFGAVLRREQLKELVDRFYLDVRADDQIGPVFERALAGRWDTHLARMVDFWSTVMLGSRDFRGNVFGKHMALGPIGPSHFARWLTLWHKNTNALFPPGPAKELQDVAHGIARNLFYGHHQQFAEFVVQDGRVVDCIRHDQLPDVARQA